MQVLQQKLTGAHRARIPFSFRLNSPSAYVNANYNERVDNQADRDVSCAYEARNCTMRRQPDHVPVF